MTDPAATLTCPSCGAANLPGSRFCSSCATPLEAAAAPAVETRKVVTVLFIDATSSTALGERIDPESLRSLMTRYFDVMREVIEFHGGVVEKFIGDAVMAVFGVPTVHEDDALRACRAALDIRARLEMLDSEIRAERGASVEWRMGINTGEVVAGDAGTGQRIVTGDAVNVAARLEGAAMPGQILLGADTFALVRASVEAEPVEALTLKGKGEPVAAWKLTSVASEAIRHGHSRPMDAPLVGRQRPLRLLEQALQEAVEERVCHLFTILGVAGVGKSRIVEEFVANLGAKASVASGRCLAYGHGITYWPVAEAIRSGAGLDEDASPDAAVARLRRLLGDGPETDRVLTVAGDLLGIPGDAPAPEEMFWGIRRMFEAMARERPLLLVFDDVHWGQPTFLDLVDHIADWTRDAPILLIAMARPELLETRPAWGGGKRWVTTMQVEPLSDDESSELVAGLIGNVALPDELRTQISQAAEGNPLFVEELLGKLIDDGFLVQAGEGWATLGDLRQLAIPSTIQALLAARLDGLGSEERAVIERAAVEGKVFHRGAVVEMAPEPMRPQVGDRLTSLMRMELVRPDQASFVGEEAFRFRHLLIRDAAYQALAKQTRSELHERFAAWLERIAADRLAEYEEIIGYHLEQAYRYRAELGPPDDHAIGLAERAGRLLAEAARRAYARADTAATAALVERGIELLPRKSRERLLLIGQLGRVFLEAGSGTRAGALLEDALDEARAVGDDRSAAWIEMSLVELRSSTQSTEGAVAVRDAERLRDRLAELGDVNGAGRAELIAAFSLFTIGRTAEAVDRALPLVDADELEPWVRLEARRTAGASSVWGPTPVDEAIERIESMSRDKEGGFGARVGISRLRALQGRFDEALSIIEEARRVFEERGDMFLLAESKGARGEIVLAQGDPERAIPDLRASYDGKVSTGDRAFASTSACALANALLVAGDLDEAMDFATIGVTTSASDDIASQGGGRAIQARVLSRRGQHEEAESVARRAMSIMDATDYLSWRAEVLVHAAHVFHESGKLDEARALAERAIGDYDAKGATWPATATRQLVATWDAGE